MNCSFLSCAETVEIDEELPGGQEAHDDDANDNDDDDSDDDDDDDDDKDNDDDDQKTEVEEVCKAVVILCFVCYLTSASCLTPRQLHVGNTGYHGTWVCRQSFTV